MPLAPRRARSFSAQLVGCAAAGTLCMVALKVPERLCCAYVHVLEGFGAGFPPQQGITHAEWLCAVTPVYCFAPQEFKLNGATPEEQMSRVRTRSKLG